MKTYAKALPLFGNYSLVMADRSGLHRELKTTVGPKSHPEDPEEQREAEERKRKWMAANRRRSKERKERQRQAEQMQTTGDHERMCNITKRSNAALRHLAVFINVVEWASENGKPAALGELKKRLSSEEAAIKEWKTIRDWLKHKAPTICAVSIGRKPKGWWVIRWVIVKDIEETDIFPLAAPLPLYLVNKRGWQTRAIGMEVEARRLLDHYRARQDDPEETLREYVSEMFDVYRAQLAMPSTSRTYRSEGTEGVLDRRTSTIKPSAAHVVNGLPFGKTSPSSMALCEVEMKRGLVDKAVWLCAREDDEEAEEEDSLGVPEGDF